MAITLDAAALAKLVNGGDQWDAAETTRMFELATACYQSEALHDPDIVPDALSDEFIVRIAGYLSQSRDSVGQLDLGARSHAQDPGRSSGARALIATFRSYGA